MQVKVSGVFHDHLGTQDVNGRDKHEWVIKTDGEYPQHLKLETWGKSVDFVKQLKPGDEVECSVDLKGRKYEGQKGVFYFNSLNCWRVEKKNVMA